MENNSNPLIYGKIASIMRECPAIGKDQRNDIIVHLPERADRQERETDQNSPLIVELHG